MDSSVEIFDCIIIGGGASGVFAALTAKKRAPQATILILEETRTLLSKVRISGGGRCNVTNACFDPKKLVQNYPRGSQELLGPFYKFQPKNMMEWLEQHKVALKVEAEARVFPVTNSSETIIKAFLDELDQLQIPVHFDMNVCSITKEDALFKICTQKASFHTRAVLLATGSSQQGFFLAKSLGHTIIDPVPSLFSFVIQNFSLESLSGVALDSVQLHIPTTKFTSSGPLLITHTGFSGPATLTLSAFAARYLATNRYASDLHVNWLPHVSKKEIIDTLELCKQKKPHSLLATENPFLLPKKLWKHFLGMSGEKKCKDFSHQELQALTKTLSQDSYSISGKAQHKGEFVTCGGVACKEVDFRTLESKYTPCLFFAGEILDIDGITGGFNLQNAWTTGFIAGSSINFDEKKGSS